MPKSAKKSASKVDSASAVVAKSATKKGKRDAEQIVDNNVASGKKPKIANGGATPHAVDKKNKNKKTKKLENSESEEEDEKVVEPKETPVVNESSYNDEGSSSDGEEPTNGAVAVEKKADSDDESESDEEDAKAAKSAAEVEEDSGSEEENSSEEEDEAKTEKKDDADVEMADVPSTKKESQATGSKTLFMGNLSFSIEESDVIDFFKDVAEVVEVRFSMRDDRFAGYGHVEFATPEAAQKALELNGELLFDRAVKLDLAKERGAYTPNNGSSQKSGQAQGLTVFVRGFGTDDGFDSVRSTLEKHFGQCGEITRMSIPKDFESGGPKGVAFIDFTDSNAFNKALELSGSDVSGGTITVEEAKQRSGGGGGGGGGFGRGRGGRFGGRGGGRGRFGDRDGGRGRGRGGRGRGRGGRR